MSDHFKPLDGVATLTEILERTDGEPAVLFNHDPWCPISARAHRVMSSFGQPVAIIDVSQQRDVTRELAARTGIRHESPQVIVVRDGEVIWSASHMAITLEAVERATHSEANEPDQ